MQNKPRAEIDAAVRSMMDAGRYVEAGWMMFRKLSMSPFAPPMQVSEMRMAWYCACSFLFNSLQHGMDDTAPDTDPSEAEMKRMAGIQQEVDEFEAQYVKNVTPLGRERQRTCPRCGRATANLTDIQQGYCGACHDWT